MAVQTFLGAIFNLVTRWEAGDRLEEGLYGLLDSLKAPVPLKVGEPFSGPLASCPMLRKHKMTLVAEAQATVWMFLGSA
jgi:hypothetical protein